MTYALSVLVFLFGAYFCWRFLRVDASPRKKALNKCAPSAACWALSLYALLSARGFSLPGALLCAGLFVCTAADWALEFAFLTGAALFSLSHLMFILAFCFYAGWLPSFWMLGLSLLILYTLIRLVQQEGEKTPSRMIYAYVFFISLMASYAAKSGWIFTLGALLFMNSDLLLGLRLFKRLSGPSLGWAVMVPYYLALYLFALGSLFCL